MHLTARQREKLPLRRSPDPTDDEDEIQPLSSRAPMSGQSFDSVSTLGYEFPDVNNQTASISGDPFLSSPSPVENDEESAPWQSSRTLRTKETKNYDVAAKFSAIFDEFETLSQKAKTEKELAQLNEDKVQSPRKAEYSPEKPSDAEKHKVKGARKRGPKPKKRPAPRYSSNEACSPMAGTKVFATKIAVERRMQFEQSKLDHFGIS